MLLHALIIGQKARATYSGVFQTFKGALSPENEVTEKTDATGILIGGCVATFTATSFITACGYIGIYNYGGTKADILKGTYGNGQVGDTNVFNYLSKYFPGYTDFNYINWGWMYYYGTQTWVNAMSGSSGDIVT